MSDTPRKDRVAVPGGVVHLAEIFRQVARLANKAGLEGWEVAAVDYGLDLDAIRKEGTLGTLAELMARVEITYRRPLAAPRCEQCYSTELTNQNDGTLVCDRCGHEQQEAQQ
jgi:hypothetical protein